MNEESIVEVFSYSAASGWLVMGGCIALALAWIWRKVTE